MSQRIFSGRLDAMRLDTCAAPPPAPPWQHERRLDLEALLKLCSRSQRSGACPAARLEPLDSAACMRRGPAGRKKGAARLGSAQHELLLAQALPVGLGLSVMAGQRPSVHGSPFWCDVAVRDCVSRLSALAPSARGDDGLSSPRRAVADLEPDDVRMRLLEGQLVGVA